MDYTDQMFQITSQTVELLDDKRITCSQGFEAGRQGRAVLLFARRSVFIDVIGTDAGISESVMLQVQDLTAIGF